MTGPSRALVTGGSGYLGRNLLRHLQRSSIPARALARSEAAVAAVEATGAQAIRADLDDVEKMREAMAGCDAVFHCAAMADDWGELARARHVNVEGTRNVLSAARAAGVRRVVHVSTEAVLVGGRPIVRANETWPLPAEPFGIYPTTKREAERAVRDAVDAGQDVVIVRPRFIWGRDDTTLLPRLLEANRTGTLKWLNGGRYLTSTCHVDNVVEGMLGAWERGVPGGIYFLADGPPVEFRAFITRLLGTQGVAAGNASIPLALAHVGAIGAEAAWRLLKLTGSPPLTRTALKLMGEEVTVDDTRARRELGYVGRVTHDDGLRELEDLHRLSAPG